MTTKIESRHSSAGPEGWGPPDGARHEQRHKPSSRDPLSPLGWDRTGPLSPSLVCTEYRPSSVTPGLKSGGGASVLGSSPLRVCSACLTRADAPEEATLHAMYGSRPPPWQGPLSLRYEPANPRTRERGFARCNRRRQQS